MEKEYNPRDKFVYTVDNLPELITNDTIQCKDCVFRYDKRVIECEKYIRKPDYVLDKEAPCPKYQKRPDTP